MLVKGKNTGDQCFQKTSSFGSYKHSIVWSRIQENEQFVSDHYKEHYGKRDELFVTNSSS